MVVVVSTVTQDVTKTKPLPPIPTSKKSPGSDTNSYLSLVNNVDDLSLSEPTRGSPLTVGRRDIRSDVEVARKSPQFHNFLNPDQGKSLTFPSKQNPKNSNGRNQRERNPYVMVLVFFLH